MMKSSFRDECIAEWKALSPEVLMERKKSVGNLALSLEEPIKAVVRSSIKEGHKTAYLPLPFKSMTPRMREEYASTLYYLTQSLDMFVAIDLEGECLKIDGWAGRPTTAEEEEQQRAYRDFVLKMR